MKGRLWQCDREWKRLASQSAEFSNWPRASQTWFFVDSNREEQVLRGISCPERRLTDQEIVRFYASGGNFELEKLP